MGNEADRLFKQIRELILTARRVAARNVDTLQVMTNFEIGRRIVEYEQKGSKRAEYGKETLKELSRRLAEEFGRGFSERNLEYMRKFYLLYAERMLPISQMPSAKLRRKQSPRVPSGTDEIKPYVKGQSVTFQSTFVLSWSQYVFLISINDKDERRFYEIEAANNGWTLPELKRQFDSGLFERLALSRDKKGIKKLAQEGHVVAQPRDLLKEPYILEFLGLAEQAKYSESDLEAAIIDKLERFLLELGKGFLFEARQKRFTFDEEHFFVDLVFYNRLLHCYVLLDLKIGKLTHQDLGQMQMYVNYYDRQVRLAGENPTVGIVLCKMKNRALVEITLPKNANVFASEYKLYLPSKEELKQKLLEWTEEETKELARSSKPQSKKRRTGKKETGKSGGGKKR
jgi:predicted nuclease of restriction endonuclease-like (RecB) superfamily